MEYTRDGPRVPFGTPGISTGIDVYERERFRII